MGTSFAGGSDSDIRMPRGIFSADCYNTGTTGLRLLVHKGLWLVLLLKGKMEWRRT